MLLVNANLAYSAMPLSLSGNKLEDEIAKVFNRNNKTQDLSSSHWSSASSVFGNSSKWLDRPSWEALDLPKMKNAEIDNAFLGVFS